MFFALFLWAFVQISMWPCADFKNLANSSWNGYRIEDGVWNHTIKGENISKGKNYSLWQGGANWTAPRPTPQNVEPHDPKIMFITEKGKKKVKLAKCAHTQVFDKNQNKCRDKLSSTSRKVPSTNSKIWDTEGDNCSKEWGLMESDEYTILTNQSIYVNSSDTLYDPPQYTWQNQSLFVCDSFGGDPDIDEAWSSEDKILSFLTIVCMSISIIALIFVLVIYALFTELRTAPGINLMNLSVAILLAQLLWLLGSGQTDNSMACTAIAVLLHYFFLVSFMWTSIIAFDTWRTFTTKGRRSMVDSKHKRLLHSLRYMAVGWLSVMVYVSICVALDQSQTVAIGYGSRAACWITNFNAKWIFFATPLGLVTVFNIVFFYLTVKSIRSTRNQAKMVDNSASKRDFGVYVRIASVMGFTWVFGFAAPFGWVFLWYVFVILSSLQGVYIAIAFALNKRARKLYCKMCKTKESESSDENKNRDIKVKSFPLSAKVLPWKGQVEVSIIKH